VITKKWDQRFLEMASLVSTWSKDPSTQAGAVIVRPDLTIASVGFNGFARTMKDDPELYADREKKYSRIIHCEVNALIHAAGPVPFHTLFTYPFMPCDRCVVQMIQAGVARFVFSEASEDHKDRWADAFAKTIAYIEEAGCGWKEYSYGEF